METFFVWSCAYFIPTCVDNKQRNSANMKYFDGFYAFIISTMDKYESMSLAKYSIYISNSSHKHHYSHCWEFLSNWYYWAFIPNSRKTFSFSLPQIICLTFILEVNPVFVVALSFIYQKFIVEYDDVSGIMCSLRYVPQSKEWDAKMHTICSQIMNEHQTTILNDWKLYQVLFM